MTPTPVPLLALCSSARLEPLHQHAPVCETGERVVGRLVPELLLHLLVVRDVSVLGEDVRVAHLGRRRGRP